MIIPVLKIPVNISIDALIIEQLFMKDTNRALFTIKDGAIRLDIENIYANLTGAYTIYKQGKNSEFMKGVVNGKAIVNCNGGMQFYSDEKGTKLF
jgi:hypothetical protein